MHSLLTSLQIKCATAVFESNTPFLTISEQTTSDHQSPTDVQNHSNSSLLTNLPSLKVFLAGKTFGVSILQRAIVSHDLLEVQSDYSQQTMMPLMHIFVYNPFMTVQIHRGCIECELSCFNMAGLYSHKPVPVCKSY